MEPEEYLNFKNISQLLINRQSILLEEYDSHISQMKIYIQDLSSFEILDSLIESIDLLTENLKKQNFDQSILAGLRKKLQDSYIIQDLLMEKEILFDKPTKIQVVRFQNTNTRLQRSRSILSKSISLDQPKNQEIIIQPPSNQEIINQPLLNQEPIRQPSQNQEIIMQPPQDQEIIIEQLRNDFEQPEIIEITNPLTELPHLNENRITSNHTHELNYISLQKQLLQQCNALFQQCLLEEEEIKLDDCFDTLQHLGLKLTQLDSENLRQFHTENPSYNKTLRNNIKTHDYIEQNIKELNSQGWTTDCVKHGISVKYKFPEQSSNVSILMETIIPVEAIVLCALINETDLYPQYVPFCIQAKVVKMLGRTNRIAYALINMPVITDRELYFEGFAIDRLNRNGTFILTSRTVDSDKEFLEDNQIDIPEKSKLVRLIIHRYVFEIEPLSTKSCKIRSLANIDPQVSFIPNSIIAWTGRKFAFGLFDKIISYAKKFEKSPWYPYYQKNKVFYDWVQSKLDKFYEDKGLINKQTI